jgi:GTP-binding protein Era
LFVINGEEGVGPGDRFIARLLRSSPVPVVIAVNKLDRASRANAAAALDAAASLDVADEIFPTSARTGEGIGPLTAHLIALLAPGPFYFEREQRSDLSEAVRLAELIREQVLRLTREEVPHAVEVQVESIEDEGELIRIVATLLVETESQKGILIGAAGRMIKSIGTAGRRAVEQELGRNVHLELRVRVRRHWRADARLLDRLGIE